ncbi:MAG: PIG-L family deacetylase [Kiritimatiellae bacterium]|nr:PIG-L family deacetylase [Kiritimatiellia bacterium]
MACFGRADQAFFGVTVTNGAGTPRDGIYAGLTEAEMIGVRRKEQKKAAIIGEYAGVALLDYPSATVKDMGCREPTEDMKTLFIRARPRIVYTHNPADRHDTHVAVMLRVVAALRELPEEARPAALYGMEVWRDLDWLVEDDKVCHDVSGHDNLASALVEVFDSQNCGRKRYDLAAMARRRAHAVYARFHSQNDTWTHVAFGMDMTPLLRDPALSVMDYTLHRVERFRDDIAQRIERLSPGGRP